MVSSALFFFAFRWLWTHFFHPISVNYFSTYILALICLHAHFLTDFTLPCFILLFYHAFLHGLYLFSTSVLDPRLTWAWYPSFSFTLELISSHASHCSKTFYGSGLCSYYFSQNPSINYAESAVLMIEL